MLYPKRFASGSAHNLRVAALRDVADSTQDENGVPLPPFVIPLRFHRFQRANEQDQRTRGWYVVDFGNGEIALEKGQVELVLLGFVGGSVVSGTMTRETAEEWIGKLLQTFEEDRAPKPWTA